MAKILSFNYYRDRDPLRQKEINFCVEKNLKLKFIDEYWIFVEDFDYIKDIPNDKRCKFFYIKDRMEFIDPISYMHLNRFDGDILIIINLDIYLDNSPEWYQLEEFFNTGYEHKALVLKRHNLDRFMRPYKEEPYWTRGQFCDAWVIRLPFDARFLREDLRFCVGGAPQCDNLMMYLMTKYWHTYSWGEKYKIYHYDLCRKGAKTEIITNDKTDWRPSKRKGEHIAIPAYQNWDELLETCEPPIIKPSHMNIVPKWLKAV